MVDAAVKPGTPGKAPTVDAGLYGFCSVKRVVEAD